MAQASRRALTDISVLKSLETGQPVSADLTAPGTRETRSRWLLVMAKPSGNFSSVIVAEVSSFCAVIPALPSCAERAMVKQPAWAAARSSSGLVPTPFSKRVLKEYCDCFKTPLSVESVPLPSFKPPCQTAVALRCMCFAPFRLIREFKTREFDSWDASMGILPRWAACVEQFLNECHSQGSQAPAVGSAPGPVDYGAD